MGDVSRSSSCSGRLGCSRRADAPSQSHNLTSCHHISAVLRGFNNVWDFTGSASYNKKAHAAIFQGLFRCSRHITCSAHLLELVPVGLLRGVERCGQTKKVSFSRCLHSIWRAASSPIMQLCAVQTQGGLLDLSAGVPGRALSVILVNCFGGRRIQLKAKGLA